MEAVLHFLSTVPDPMGKPALDFVLTEWCSKQHLFYGAYESKVSALALCKLMQHAIENNDSRLQGILVNGEQIHSEQGIRTRSKSASHQGWYLIYIIIYFADFFSFFYRRMDENPSSGQNVQITDKRTFE